jgi:hypothetical protein
MIVLGEARGSSAQLPHLSSAGFVVNVFTRASETQSPEVPEVFNDFNGQLALIDRLSWLQTDEGSGFEFPLATLSVPLRANNSETSTPREFRP